MPAAHVQERVDPGNLASKAQGPPDPPWAVSPTTLLVAAPPPLRCEPGSSRVAPDPTDCRYYYQCSPGPAPEGSAGGGGGSPGGGGGGSPGGAGPTLRRFYCGESAVFDPTAASCVSPNTVKRCAGLTTRVREPERSEYTHTRTHTHTHKYSQTSRHQHTVCDAHTRHTCTQTHTHAHTHTHTHKHTHTNTHTQTHTHTHTHTSTTVWSNTILFCSLLRMFPRPYPLVPWRFLSNCNFNCVITKTQVRGVYRCVQVGTSDDVHNDATRVWRISVFCAGAYTCSGQGYYRDRSDCNKFYRCTGHTRHYFSCPDGLVFDEGKAACDYPSQVLPLTGTTPHRYYPSQVLPLTGTTPHRYYPSQVLPLTGTTPHRYCPSQVPLALGTLLSTSTVLCMNYQSQVLPFSFIPRRSEYCSSQVLAPPPTGSTPHRYWCSHAPILTSIYHRHWYQCSNGLLASNLSRVFFTC